MFYWETVHPSFNVAIVSKRTCIGAWSFELWTVRFIQRSLFGSYFIYRSLFLLGVGSSVFWNLTYSSEFLVTRYEVCCLVFLKFLFYFGGLLPLPLSSHCPRWRSLSISGSLSQAIGGWRRRLVADGSAVSFYPRLSTLTNYHLHLLKAPACLYSLRSFDSVADEFICFSCVRIADNNLSPPIFHVTSCRFFSSYNFILLTELVWKHHWLSKMTENTLKQFPGLYIPLTEHI